MGRRREKPLPAGVYERVYASGSVFYWITFVDQHGDRQRESGGETIAKAEALLRKRRREVQTGTYRPDGAEGGMLLADYVEPFLAHRTRRVKTVEDDRARLRDHIVPRLGDRPLAAIEPRDVEAFVLELVDADELAPKTVVNVHSTLAALLERARYEKLIDANPAHDLPAGTLPGAAPARDPLPFTRDEAQLLVFDRRIALERRVAHAMGAFCGARTGEIIGARWRDLDTDAPRLWRWSLRSQYDGKSLKGSSAKPGAPRDVPIHPRLRELLEEWRREGWPQHVRRHPRPDDLIVPREDGTMHSKESLGAKSVGRAARVVGIAMSGTAADGTTWSKDAHSFRRFFITTTQVDGAREEVVRRITHDGRPRGRIMQRYTVFPWETLCDAVSMLHLEPLAATVAELAPARRAAPGDDQPARHASGHAKDEAPGISMDSGGLGMEAPGVEEGAEVVGVRFAAVSGGGGRFAGVARTAGKPGGPRLVSSGISRVTSPSGSGAPVDVARVHEAIDLLSGIGHVLLADAVRDLLAELEKARTA